MRSPATDATTAVLGSTRQTTCHAAVCTVLGCGYVLDEEENEERHYNSPQQAYDDALNFTWTTDAQGFLICPAEDDDHDSARKPTQPTSPQPGPGQTALADVLLGTEVPR